MTKHFVCLTGAGISADSGLATFRDAGGLWEGHAVEDVATPEGWARDPALVWRFYQERRAGLLEAQPNAAHHALVKLERRLAVTGGTFTLISQNVDDLHQRAGSPVLDMHGQLLRLRCEECGQSVLDSEHLDPEVFVACGLCGHPRMRPDVVWFGEIPRHLDAIAVHLSQAEVFLCIGTSGMVYPAAGLLSAARASGAETWVNSLEEPDNLGASDHFLGGRAAQVIPARVEAWLSEW